MNFELPNNLEKQQVFEQIVSARFLLILLNLFIYQVDLTNRRCNKWLVWHKRYIGWHVVNDQCYCKIYKVPPFLSGPCRIFDAKNVPKRG